MKKSSLKLPKTASPEAKKWATSLAEQFRIIDAAGELLLHQIVECFDRLRAAQAILAKEGICPKDRFGQPRQHPATLIERDARGALMKALRQLDINVELPETHSSGTGAGAKDAF